MKKKSGNSWRHRALTVIQCTRGFGALVGCSSLQRQTEWTDTIQEQKLRQTKGQTESTKLAQMAWRLSHGLSLLFCLSLVEIFRSCVLMVTKHKVLLTRYKLTNKPNKQQFFTTFAHHANVCLPASAGLLYSYLALAPQSLTTRTPDTTTKNFCHPSTRFLLKRLQIPPEYS